MPIIPSMVVVRQHPSFKGYANHPVPEDQLEKFQKDLLSKGLYPVTLGYYLHAFRNKTHRPQGIQDHVLIICTDGEGWVNFDGQVHTVEAGQMLLLPKGTPHAYAASDENPWTYFWVHFRGSEADNFIRRVADGPLLDALSAPALRMSTKILEHAINMASEGWGALKFFYTSQALQHILAMIALETDVSEQVVKKDLHLTVEVAIAFMERNLSRNLTLKEIADACGVSVSHLCAKFRLERETSPMDYFTQIRMQAASSLLDTTQLSIQEVGKKIGYEDPYHFSKAFKRVTTKSPRAYRNR